MSNHKVPEWAWRIGRKLREEVPPDTELPNGMAELVKALEQAEASQSQNSQ